MQLNAAEMRTRRRKRQLTGACGVTAAILVFQAVMGCALAASPEAPPPTSSSPTSALATPNAPPPSPPTPQSQSSDRVTRNVAGSWAQMIEDYRKSANDVLFPYDLVDVMEKHNEAQVLKALPKLAQGRATRNPDPRAVLLFLEKELDRARKGKNKVSMDADASLWDLDRFPRRLSRRRRQVSDSDQEQEPVLASDDESERVWAGVASVGRQVPGERGEQGVGDDNGGIPAEVVDRLSELNLSVAKPVLELISTGDFQVDTPPPALLSTYNTADGGDADSEWVVQQQPVPREVLQWVPSVPAAEQVARRQRGQNTVFGQDKDYRQLNAHVVRKTTNKQKNGGYRSMVADNKPEKNVAWETVTLAQDPRGVEESGAHSAVNPKKYERKKKKRKKLKMKKRIPEIPLPLSNDDIFPTHGPLDENLSAIEEEPIIYNMPPIFQDVLFGDVNDLQSTTPSPWAAIYIGGQEEVDENKADALPQDKQLTTPPPPQTTTTTSRPEVKKPNLARSDSQDNEFTGDKILDAYISKHVVHSANGTEKVGPFEPLPTPLPDASAANMPPQSLTTSARDQRDQSGEVGELQANHSLLSEPSNNKNVRTNAVTWLMHNDADNNKHHANPSTPYCIDDVAKGIARDAVVEYDEIKPIVSIVESVARSSKILAPEFEDGDEAKEHEADKQTPLATSKHGVAPQTFEDKATGTTNPVMDEEAEPPVINLTQNENTSFIRDIPNTAELGNQHIDTESLPSHCPALLNQEPSPTEVEAVQGDKEDIFQNYQTTTENMYEVTDSFPYFATTEAPPINKIQTDAEYSETSITTEVAPQNSLSAASESTTETVLRAKNVDFSANTTKAREGNNQLEQQRTAEDLGKRKEKASITLPSNEESTTPLLPTSGIVFEERDTELNRISTPKASKKPTVTTTVAPKKKKKKKKKKGKGGWNLDFLPTTTTTTPAPWPYSLVSLAPFFRFPYGSVFRRTPRESADGEPDLAEDDAVLPKPKPFPTRSSLTGREHSTVRPSPLRGTTSPTLPRRANAQRERLDRMDTHTPPLPALPLKEYFSRFGLKDSDLESTKSAPTLTEHPFHPRPARFYSKYWDVPSFKGNLFTPASPKFQLPWNSNGLLGRMKRAVGLPVEDDPLPPMEDGGAYDEPDSEAWRLPRAPRERLRGLPRGLPRPLPPLPPALEELIPRRNESEAEKAEREHKAVQRMIQLVNVMGSLQQFLSDRTRSVVKRLYKVITEDENNARM